MCPPLGKLSVLNGRVIGDLLETFTCYKPNGASVVDYAILSSALIKHVIYFSVLPLSFFSCYCPISFAIKTNVFHTDEKFNNFLLPKPPYFKWDSERIEMNSEQTILRNEIILRDLNLSNFSSDSIDNAVTYLTEVSYDNAKKCFALKRHRVKRSARRSKNKNWFDKDCETAKKEFLVAAETLQRYPKDPIVRGKYHKLKTDYKLLVKYKEHSFREIMLQRISQLASDDPKTFWEMVNKVETHRDENLTDNTDPLEWQEWLKN